MIIFNRILFILILYSISILIINKIYKKKINNLLIEFLPTLILIFIFRSFIYEPFIIPSSSMMPTLLIGDLILVNKLFYNIKNPLNNNTIFNIGKPNYGDIVVFQYPKNKNINYVKRIIGLPKDKIIYNEKKKEIYIYKYSKNKNKYINIVKYTNKKISPYIEEIIFLNKNIREYIWNINKKIKKNYNSEIIFLNEKIEYLKNYKHKILLLPFTKHKNKINSWIVPNNMYFVIGDYRDNSEDSRYWGFLHQDLIIGKVQYIWMSLEKQENNWPTGIRLDRIGKIF